MTTDTETPDSLISSITKAIKMSGSLFQRHPDTENWKTTRPVAPEVVCFSYEGDGHGRISVRFYRAGETDRGSDFEWQRDSYEVESIAPSGCNFRDVAHDRDSAAEVVARHMQQINTA